MTTENALRMQVKASLLGRDTIKLMRIPFSYFLMPVFVFALSQASDLNVGRALLCFIILHLFIYPASNGYNSYMDNDEGSIGGLKRPPKPTKSLFYLSLIFDLAGLALSLFINLQFFFSVMAYTLVSRAYSYKGIRLKRYPVAGFLTTVFFQGAFTFWMVYNAINKEAMAIEPVSVLVLSACSFLIAGFYPLTQVYQHDEDKKHGDITLSYILGYKGTFVFTAIMFVCAAALLFFYFHLRREQSFFLLFLLFSLPVVIYFFWWFVKVIQDRNAASFEHTMTMNRIAATFLNLCFFTFLILNTTR